MKKLIVLIPLLASCQWIVTHPKEDAEAVSVIETIGKDLYDYESGKPLLPLVTPAPTTEYKPSIQ